MLNSDGSRVHYSLLVFATAVAATAAGDLGNQNRFATLLLLGGGSSETRRRDWAEISKGMALLC